MPQKRLPKQDLLAKTDGKRQLYDLELDGPITLRSWMESFGNLPEQNDGFIMEDRELCQLNSELLLSNPHRKAGNKQRRRRR